MVFYWVAVSDKQDRSYRNSPGELARLLNCANPQLSLKGGRRIDKFCQRFEKLLGFAGMLQTVARLPSVGLISDKLGQAQRCQNVTHPRHAAANGSGDLTRA